MPPFSSTCMYDVSGRRPGSRHVSGYNLQRSLRPRGGCDVRGCEARIGDPAGDGAGDDATGREPRGERPRGNIMKLADSAAGVVSIRHSGRHCVTAVVDRFMFHAPVFVGNLVLVFASLNYVGRTSMEVGVRVEAEDPRTGSGSTRTRPISSWWRWTTRAGRSRCRRSSLRRTRTAAGTRRAGSGRETGGCERKRKGRRKDDNRSGKRPARACCSDRALRGDPRVDLRRALLADFALDLLGVTSSPVRLGRR